MLLNEFGQASLTIISALIDALGSALVGSDRPLIVISPLGIDSGRIMAGQTGNYRFVRRISTDQRACGQQTTTGLSAARTLSRNEVVSLLNSGLNRNS
jgi:hypothetical protein